MKLLVITQKVDMDDDVLGFFHSWLLEFAKNCERLTVICLQKGRYDLSNNVKVLSLGKENGRSKLAYLFNFYRHIWRERKNYDAVFVHMNKEYILLGGILWRLWGKKIGLWYLHKSVDLKLRVAALLANIIFTASPESCRLKSKKVKIVGHGVDVDKFRENERRTVLRKFKILNVGRISPIKNQKLLIEAVNILVNQKNITDLRVEFIGAPVYEKDRLYHQELTSLVENYGLREYIKFAGSAPNREIASRYLSSDLSVNLCPTGGMDKVVLESMAAGVPALALNKTFISVFGEHASRLILQEPDAAELAEKIIEQMEMSPDEKKLLGDALSKIAQNNFSLRRVVEKVLAEYRSEK